MRTLVAIPPRRLRIQLVVVFSSNFYILIRNIGQLVGFTENDCQIISSMRDNLRLTTANPTPRQILQNQIFWVDNTTATRDFYVTLGGIGPILNWTLLIVKLILY